MASSNNNNNISLETYIGNIKLDNPFLNASGCHCYSDKELDDLNKSDSGAFITKTITMDIRKGNPEPRYFHNAHLSINSMGLPNLGFTNYNNYAYTYKVSRVKPLFFSISTMNIDNTKQMIENLSITYLDSGIKGLEFNISCPNIIGKGQMGYDMEQLNDFLKLISISPLNNISRNDIAIGLKMSPYFDNYQFNQVADIIKEYPRIDFITCINGIGNGLVIDPIREQSVIKPNSGCGGLGGSIVKPIGLSNVKKFKALFGEKIDIIGCGGVSTGLDAFEYILSGANAVSVGTQLMREGPHVFNRLNEELMEIMEDKEYKKITDYKNKINFNNVNNNVNTNISNSSLDYSLTMC